MPLRYALCWVRSEFLHTPLCYKTRVKTEVPGKLFLIAPLCHKTNGKTKPQNENYKFSLRCTIQPSPVYALWWYLLRLSITPLCYKLRFKNDSSWRNSSHLPIAQNRGVKRNTFWKIYTFFKKWEQDSYCELQPSSPLYRTKWGSKRKCFLKISQKLFQAAKMPGANASRIRSRRKIWHYWHL